MMPINVTEACSAPALVAESAWHHDSVILYHLGVGAGSSLGEDELGYLLETDLKVLPSFAVIPVTPLIARYNDVPGMDVDESRVLHGEHHLEIHRPLGPVGEVTNRMTISSVYDKGSAAVVVATITTHDKHTDELLASHQVTYFMRGEGGAGDKLGAPDGIKVPARTPDVVAQHPTAANQALIYRLCGDKNALHADPRAARAAGLDAPILHGLCTFGIACKSAVDHVLGGDPTAISTMAVRFTGVAYPGEVLEVSLWEEADCLLLEAAVTDRGATVLRGRITTTTHR
jgi:acyl dehydratase